MNKNSVAVENFLRPAARCAILKMKKGKPETHGLPLKMKKLNALQHQPFTIGSSGRLFSVLKNLIEQTDKGNNECTKKKKFLVCNHWHPLLSFVWRVKPLRNMEGRPPFMCS